MSKKLSYKGTLAPGTQEKIRLKTLKGKTGYKITKFQLISTLPGTTNIEYVGKITKITENSIIGDVQLTDSNIMAVCYYVDNNSSAVVPNQTIITDNEITNQDIFVNISDVAGGSVECNYYIELESMDINDLQATQLTLQNTKSLLSQ